MSNNSSITDGDNGYDDILLIRLIVWGYLGMVLSIFGIFGNIITVLVLISPSMRTTSTNIYLTALSCSNLLFLLIFIPSYSIRYLIGYPLYITNQPPFPFEILLTRLPTTPVYNTILLSIIYLTIAVSMDRLILVKFPLKARQILTRRATLITIVLIYLFSILYCLPYWFEQEYDPETKRCKLTSIGQKIHKIIRIHIYIPVVYVIPFTVLTCINVTIIQSLVAKNRRKRSLCAQANKKKQGDHHITLMLVAIVIAFVLCQLPLSILNAWVAIDAAHATQSILFNSLNSLGILLMVFNTSTNFLLYCFFGQKFRQTLVQFVFRIFPQRHKKENGPARISRLTERPSEKFLQPPIAKAQIQQVSSNNSTTITAVTKELNNHNEHPTNHIEESIPLITNYEQNSIINENFPLKSDPNLNLYQCANGKQILVLKI